MSLRLYERPTPRSAMARNALSIVGTLPAYTPEAPYEGRLSIVGAIGACSVRMIAGELPPGATVSVDNATSEVVVAWPAYSSGAVAIPNGDFEDGNFGWEQGPGWSRTSDNAITGGWCMKFIDHGGDSVLANSYRASITPGETVNASCQVRQGASSSGNAGACVRLDFYSADNTLLTSREGNMVAQGENNEAKLSNVSAVAPSSSAFVSIACRGFRKRQNREVWVDSFEWDVAQATVGTNLSRVWELTIRVRDSVGREAEWSGVIGVPVGQWWIVVGSIIHASPDLETWTTITRSPALEPEMVVSAGAGRAVVIGSGTECEVIDDTTPDSVIETEIVSSLVDGTSANAFSEINSFSSGAYLTLLGTVGSNQATRIRVSTDRGRTWVGYLTPSGDPAKQAMSIIRLNSGRWVCAAIAGTSSYVWFTDNPLPSGGWQLSDLPVNVYRATAKLSTNGTTVCVAPGWGGKAYYSDNGATWHETENPGDSSDDIRAAFAYGEVFLQGQGQNGIIKVSVDTGRSWTQIVLPGSGAGNVPLAFDHYNGVFTVSTTGGRRWKSVDGLVWEEITSIPVGGNILKFIPYVG